jgi:hypothetical protein
MRPRERLRRPVRRNITDDQLAAFGKSPVGWRSGAAGVDCRDPEPAPGVPRRRAWFTTITDRFA